MKANGNQLTNNDTSPSRFHFDRNTLLMTLDKTPEDTIRVSVEDIIIHVVQAAANAAIAIGSDG